MGCPPGVAGWGAGAWAVDGVDGGAGACCVCCSAKTMARLASIKAAIAIHRVRDC